MPSEDNLNNPRILRISLCDLNFNVLYRKLYRMYITPVFVGSLLFNLFYLRKYSYYLSRLRVWLFYECPLHVFIFSRLTLGAI